MEGVLTPAEDGTDNPCATISHIIQPREKDLGGFSVKRALPFARCRHIGPFVFFDHIGPARFAPGEDFNVRSHPHIGLATITYLFSGEILHKDSLGYEQLIEPGAVNFMVAGRGIVHAEKTRAEAREKGQKLEALQLWMALPDHEEEREPSFIHHPASSIPQMEISGVSVRVIMGEAFGLQSPVATLSPTLYLEISMPEKKGKITLPSAEERGLYVVSGTVEVNGTPVSSQQMAVLHPQSEAVVSAQTPAQLALIGGQSVGDRHIDWNFVAKERSRIEEAKEDWRQGRFPQVPGETDFIPLP